MLAFFIYLTCFDIWYYFIHRLLHTRYLYFIHKVHHQSYKIKYYHYYKIHILELPLQSIGILLPIYFYKLQMLQLIYAIMFINIRGLLEHDTRITLSFSNHHLIHHKLPNYNYGEYWLDYIFGTVYK